MSLTVNERDHVGQSMPRLDKKFILWWQLVLVAFTHIFQNKYVLPLMCLHIHALMVMYDTRDHFVNAPSQWEMTLHCNVIIPPPNEVGGEYTGFTLSVRPSVRPSVCRRQGFRSISQVCFGISIVNFICMLMVAIGRSLLIFSDVTFKMAVWQPYWIFWFPDSNFSLVLNIISKLKWHNTYVYV